MDRRTPALMAVVGVLLLAAPTPHAVAAPTDRDALCVGYVGTCAITPGTPAAIAGQLLSVRVQGNRSAPADLQLYSVEFNRAGQLTGLVPIGEPVPKNTNDGTATFRLAYEAAVVSGWAYIGLADESGLYVDARLGAFLGLGGTTLRLLGDGYAEQKPVGKTLDLHVLGQVASIGYWVEYRDDAGTWVPVPGQGYDQPQVNKAAPNEIMHLAYTVPAGLAPGRRYQFRTNTRLNYVCGRLIAHPAFAQWTVIPSGAPLAQGRGSNFDPAKGPGSPDPSGGPSAATTPAPTPAPTPAAPSAMSPSASTGAGRPGPAAAASGSSAATVSPAASSPSSTSPTPMSTPAPTSTATQTPSPSASATGAPSGAQQQAAAARGVVWGAEEMGAARAAVGPASDGLSGLVAVAALLLLLGPLGYAAFVRARSTRVAQQETL